jgi:hypothetical protein
MDTHNLIIKLQQAGERSLYLAEQERKKTSNGAHSALDIRDHTRAVTRENFFQGQHDTILAIINELQSFPKRKHTQEEEEEWEEIIFLARKLIAGVAYPWIRRRALSEDLYNEVYKDADFETYAEGLPLKQESLLHASIGVLGLEDKLEEELEDILRHKKPKTESEEPLIGDLVLHKDELQNEFKDDWTRKSKLVLFRLHEFGIV